MTLMAIDRITAPNLEPDIQFVNDNQARARQILFALNGAFKKILLYPPEHIIYQTALKSLKQELDHYLSRHGNLVYTIHRNKIYHKAEVVHEGVMNEENLAFILFRDGINLLEFQKKIELWEIHAVLDIFRKNQILTEDSENDIVTALWELELPSLHYEAEDVGFDSGEDFSIPPSTPVDDIDPAPRFHDPVFDWNLVEITPADREHLENMLVEEEDWERIEYVLYILLYILQQQTQPDDFSEVMAYLEQELQDAMKSQKYQSVYNTLQILKNTLYSPGSENHWSIPLLEDLFATLSTKEFLSILSNAWEQIPDCNPENLGHLKRALLLLNSDAIVALGPMLLETQSKQTRKLFMTVIGILAERDYQPFAILLASKNTDLIAWLAHIMGFMKSTQSHNELHDLLRHDSAAIRQEALKAIFRRKPETVSELSWLLDDPDMDVRQRFLTYASQRRDLKTEKMLREYLEKKRIRSSNKQLLFHVFIALGKCGSDESLPFLKKNMYILPGLGLLRSKKALPRQAAVHALKGLKTEKAEVLLKKTSRNGRATSNPVYIQDNEQVKP
jgi:hypothetical protein